MGQNGKEIEKQQLHTMSKPDSQQLYMTPFFFCNVTAGNNKTNALLFSVRLQREPAHTLVWLAVIVIAFV